MYTQLTRLYAFIIADGASKLTPQVYKCNFYLPSVASNWTATYITAYLLENNKASTIYSKFQRITENKLCIIEADYIEIKYRHFQNFEETLTLLR